MNEIRTEAIVIKRIPFKENDKIVSLFTPHLGVIKLYFKGRRRANYLTEALFTPLTRSEMLLTRGRGDFHFFKEGSLLEQNLSLRKETSFLEAAQKITSALESSQWPDKPAPDLYALYLKTLQNIPTFSPLENLLSAFLLKLLRHEGALALTPHCTQCHAPLNTSHRFGGEPFCPTHAPRGSLSLSEVQEKTLRTLALSRSLSTLQVLALPQELSQLIDTLFTQSI